jgi:D-alanine transaminase
VYEVVRIYAGKPFLLDRHLDRLRRSLEAIRIHGVDVAKVGERIDETIAAGSFQEATAYVQVTRGVYPSRTQLLPAPVAPYEIVWVEPFVDPYVQARQVGVKAITHPDRRWERCDVKSVNLLPNVLAAEAARAAGAVEAILYTADGTITEGSRTNVFGVVDGVLRTRPLGPEILPGITREFVLELARAQNVPIAQRALALDDLPRVSELFFSGTTSEVLAIVDVDGQRIGAGKPGPVAQRLHAAFRAAVRA